MTETLLSTKKNGMLFLLLTILWVVASIALTVCGGILVDETGNTILLIFGILNLLAEVVIIYALFRMFSRNTYKRREENNKFLRKVNPFLKWFRLQQTMRKDKAHRYFKCPNCSQYLRVPRGKGKITVTCRSCRASFQEKS